jgi:hypothetical protein
MDVSSFTIASRLNTFYYNTGSDFSKPSTDVFIGKSFRELHRFNSKQTKGADNKNKLIQHEKNATSLEDLACAHSHQTDEPETPRTS